MENKDNPLYPIDLNIFTDHIKSSLSSIIDKLDSKEKSIVIGSQVLKILNFFIDFSFFEERNFSGKIVTLDNSPLLVVPEVIVYIISSDITNLDHIFYQIQNHKSSMVNKKYHIIFIPKVSYDCQIYLNTKDIYVRGEVEVFSLPVDIYPIDYDILSLEINDYNYLNSFSSNVTCNYNSKNNYSSNNNSSNNLSINNYSYCLSELNKAIIKIETIYGKVKYKYAKGNNAVELLKLNNNEERIFDSENEIFASIYFDREVDMLTPMCSVNTYEGLIDEHIGINLNNLKKTDIIENDNDKVLNSKNEFYEKIRDSNFNHVKKYLHLKLQTILQIINEAKEAKDTDMKAISEGLEKFKQAQEFKPCKTHINLASILREKNDTPINIEALKKEQPILCGDMPSNLYEYYENCILQQKCFYSIIKIMILESLVFGGIKYKIYDQIKRDFLMSFGHQEIFLFKNLERLNLLKKQDTGRSNYSIMLKELNLINENVNKNEPDDASYVFDGFCPITIRLIEAAINKGWSSIKDVLKKINGKFDYPSNEKEVLNPSKKKLKFIMLVFIGGITYAELAAIRYLNKTNKEFKFFILTTNLTSGKKIINSLRFINETTMTVKDYVTQLKNK